MKTLVLICALTAIAAGDPRRIRLSPMHGDMNPYVTKPCGAVVVKQLWDVVLARPVFEVDGKTVAIVYGDKVQPADAYDSTDNPITGSWSLPDGSKIVASIRRHVYDETDGRQHAYKLVIMGLSLLGKNGCYEQWTGGAVVQQ